MLFNFTNLIKKIYADFFSNVMSMIITCKILGKLDPSKISQVLASWK